MEAEMATKKATRFVVHRQRVPENLADKRERILVSELRYDDPGRATGAIKGLLCASYLLDSLSDGGNEPLDGRIAQGLSLVLQKYAGDVSHLKPKADFPLAAAV
jgi:hypothetical protein